MPKRQSRKPQRFESQAGAPKPRVITLTEGESECLTSIERRCAVIGLLDAAEDRAG
jgi:hypothetical protein